MKPKARRRFIPEDQEKKRQRRVLFFSIFMVALMVFGVLEIVVNRGSTDSGTPLTYGDYTFSYKAYQSGGSVLVTDINGQEVEFQNLPVQVEYLEVDPVAIGLLKDSQSIILTAGTNLTAQDAATVDYARLQLSLALGKTVNAMTENDSRYSLPVVDCSRSSPQQPVVLFNITNETGVTAIGTCVIFNAEGADILRVKDRVIFEYYGILKDGQVPQ